MEETYRFRKFVNGFFKTLVLVFACCCAAPLVLIFFYIIKKGVGAVNWSLLTHLPKPVGETGGGIANAILGSIMIIFVAGLIAIPLGVLCGVSLAENREKKWAYWVGLCVEILQGIPSIVIGIAAYTWIVKPLQGFSALSGSVALSFIMLPVIIRSTEETLKLVPTSLKEASLALGAPYYKTVLNVLIPTGMSGILTGITLSIARALGESAPLLFTAFGSPYFNFNILHPMGALPLLIYNYASSPYDDWIQQAWGASFILLSIVFILNITAKIGSRRWRVRF
jgi:phosphate transport system permease protein